MCCVKIECELDELYCKIFDYMLKYYYVSVFIGVVKFVG